MKKTALILVALVALFAIPHEVSAQKFLNKLNKAIDKASTAVDKALGIETPAQPAQPAQAAQSAPAVNAGDYLISASGAGIFRFADTWSAGKKGEYTVGMEDAYETLFWVKKGEEFVLTYYPDSSMEISSPEFKTKEGVHVGMTVSEMLSKLSPMVPKIENYGGERRALVIVYSPKIGFVVNCSELKDGGKAWDAAWTKGTNYTPKTTDFKPDAKIVEIIIQK